MAPLTVLRFRYRGRIPWERIYKESMVFFRQQRRYELTESAYKDKSDEIEGDWKAELKHDEYNMIVQEIKFKLFDLKIVEGEKQRTYTGKIRLDITSSVTQNYDVKTPAGKKNIFEPDNPKTKKPSALKRLYDKITARDVENKIEDLAIETANEYITLLKNNCNTEAR